MGRSCIDGFRSVSLPCPLALDGKLRCPCGYRTTTFLFVLAKLLEWKRYIFFVECLKEWKAQGRSSELQGGHFFIVIFQTGRNKTLRNKYGFIFCGDRRRIKVPMSSQKSVTPELTRNRYLSDLGHGPNSCSLHPGCILVSSTRAKTKIQERECYFYAKKKKRYS